MSRIFNGVPSIFHAVKDRVYFVGECVYAFCGPIENTQDVAEDEKADMFCASVKRQSESGLEDLEDNSEVHARLNAVTLGEEVIL